MVEITASWPAMAGANVAGSKTSPCSLLCICSQRRLEQRLGRIRAEASLEAVAALLLGACLQRAMNRPFSGTTSDASSDDRFVADLVAMLVQGLKPPD